jgi:hypothetical protein
MATAGTVPTTGTVATAVTKTGANSERRLDLVVGALLWLTYAWFHQGGFSNQNTRFDLALALTFEHRSAIDTFAVNTIDKVLVGGHYYLEKAPGATYLALPVPLLASCFWSVGDLLGEPWRADLLLYAATVTSVSLLTAIAGVAFRRTLLLLNPDLDPLDAVMATLAIFGGTLILPYATMLFGHACAASWITLGLYGLLRGAREQHSRWMAFGWFALGAVVLTEYPAASVALGVGTAVLVAAPKATRIALLRTAAFGAIPCLGILLHNAISFGSPLAFGYGKLGNTAFATGMSRGFFGISVPSSSALVQLLLGTYRGLFFYSPLLGMTLAGYAFWPPELRRRLGGPLLAGAALLVLIVSGYTYWQGGTCFGPRHLIALVPVLGLGAAFLPATYRRSPPTLLLALTSLGIALLGTVITPFVAEERLSPMTEAYLPLLQRGEVSIHPLAFLTPAMEASYRHAHYRAFPMAALNLGELIGLRGWWSLLPLAVVWALSIRWFVRRLGPDQASARAESSSG